jgi:hypothetical protein
MPEQPIRSQLRCLIRRRQFRHGKTNYASHCCEVIDSDQTALARSIIDGQVLRACEIDQYRRGMELCLAKAAGAVH